MTCKGEFRCPGYRSSRGKIIFDMDGVITGESCYWDAAALVVWELLWAPGYMRLPLPQGLPHVTTRPNPEEISMVRQVVFQGDEVISFFKHRALNSNWDLAFLVFSYQLVELFRGFSRVGLVREDLPQVTGEAFDLDHLKEYGFLYRSVEALHWQPRFSEVLGPWAGEARGLDLMDMLARRVPAVYAGLTAGTFQVASRLWRGVQRVFQEWYFGDQKYRSFYGEEPLHPGKEGLIHREEPVLPQDRIQDTLEGLRRQGWTLGIATGRPFNELHGPLQEMKIWDYFDADSVVTFTDVEQAEKELKLQGIIADEPSVSLGKPHPFTFLKAYWAGTYEEEALASPKFPRPPEDRCWVVGDSLADLLAAREMGVGFIGVLTGHDGSSNESLFQREGARAVFPDITYLPRFFHAADSPEP